MRERRNRRLFPLYRRIELLLLLLLVLLLQYPVEVGAVRIKGVAPAAVDATAATATSAAHGRRLRNLAIAHLAAHHAAGRVL